MAADNSPPRIQPIVITAFMAVLTLFGLKFVFDSYYVEMFEAEEYRKVGSVEPTALLALRAAEKKSFAAAPIPIDRAMDLIAKGRAEPIAGLKNDIIAQPSSDLSPLAGWALTPRLVTAPSADAGAPATPSSAGPDGSAPIPAGPAGSAAPAPSGSAAAPVPAGSAAVAPAGSAAPAASNKPAPAPSAPSSGAAGTPAGTPAGIAAGPPRGNVPSAPHPAPSATP